MARITSFCGYSIQIGSYLLQENVIAGAAERKNNKIIINKYTADLEERLLKAVLWYAVACLRMKNVDFLKYNTDRDYQIQCEKDADQYVIKKGYGKELATVLKMAKRSVEYNDALTQKFLKERINTVNYQRRKLKEVSK